MRCTSLLQDKGNNDLKLLFQQLQILIYSCPRQPAYAGKFAGVHMPSLKRGKVLIEDRWNIVLCGGLAAYLLALRLGVGDARPHALPYNVTAPQRSVYAIKSDRDGALSTVTTDKKEGICHMK